MTRKPDTFASRLKRLRESAGLSAAELARLSGVSPQLLHKMESGKTQSPRLADAARLVQAMGKSLSEFDGVAHNSKVLDEPPICQRCKLPVTGAVRFPPHKRPHGQFEPGIMHEECYRLARKEMDAEAAKAYHRKRLDAPSD